MSRTWLEVLKEEFAARQAMDSKFSLRAFARLIGIAPSSLSCILTGQRNMTPRVAMKVVDRCQFSEEKRHEFLRLAVGQVLPEIASRREDREFRVLNDEELERIAHWQHYAILSLAHMPKCQSDPSWIAHRLNVPEEVAEAALCDLVELAFIEVRGRRLRRLTRSVRSKSDFPQAHVRKFHAELMNKGLESLESSPVEGRDITAVTMPANSRRLRAAKRKIKAFRRHLMEFLAEGPKDSIYAMQVSLFPLVPSPQLKQLDRQPENMGEIQPGHS